MESLVSLFAWPNITFFISITVLCGTNYIKGCHIFSENGEWGKRGANTIASPWRKVWHPLWPVENGECELPFCRPHVVRIYALFTRLDFKSNWSSSCTFCSVEEATLGEKQRPVVKPSPRSFSILHSPPMEEQKFHSPFSENEPSAVQGERATSPFSILREWEERGVTTLDVYEGQRRLNESVR